MAVIEKLVITRLRCADVRVVKRRVLTTLGSVDILWNLLLIAGLIMQTLSSIRHPGFFTLTGVGAYLVFFFGANIVMSLPLLALRRLARRWDTNHWAFRMANYVLRFTDGKSNELSQTQAHGRTYIQIFVRLSSRI